ncbi:hypothetical protein F4808DRAFT_430655 [Astrocystis sublimbata]|nr:hypothetical protein F4808DRAFT_430655 [Astrocystis sublimbata]
MTRAPSRGPSSASSRDGGAPISRAPGQPQTSPIQARGTAPGKFDDRRLLLRASPERRMAADGREPYMLRQRLVAALRPEGLALKDVPDCTVTKTGWSLRCVTPQIRDQILGARNRVLEALQLVNIETPSTWYNYVVPDLPSSFPDFTGRGTVLIENLIKDEVKAQTGRIPVDFRRSRHYTPGAPKGTWIISFTEPVPRFKLFNAGGESRII